MNEGDGLILSLIIIDRGKGVRRGGMHCRSVGVTLEVRASSEIDGASKQATLVSWHMRSFVDYLYAFVILMCLFSQPCCNHKKASRFISKVLQTNLLKLAYGPSIIVRN